MFYVLDKANRPVRQNNIIRWQKWIESGRAVKAREKIGRWRVTTIFHGVDYLGIGPWFETFFEGMPEAGKAMMSPDYETAMSCHRCLVAMARLYEAGIDKTYG